MPVEKSAGAVVFRQEDKKTYYLLLHYQSGHWDFPKGNIEKNEEPEETVRREVREETGINDLEFVPGFKQTIKYFYKRDNKNFMKFVTFFLAQTQTQEVKISWEHQGYKWLKYEDALEQLTFSNAKEILKKAGQFLSSKR